jgi:hypothetical protein
MIWPTARAQSLSGSTLLVNEVRQQRRNDNWGPREDQRRRQCSTSRKMHGMTRQSAARSVTDRSVSSGTIPGELPSVQRSALNASKAAARRTANGYADFRPPPSWGAACKVVREFTRFRNSENNECAPWASRSDSSCGAAVYWRGCHSRRKRVKVGLLRDLLHNRMKFSFFCQI